jgi:hypothetical protein
MVLLSCHIKHVNYFFFFRDYKNPDLVNEEGSDSDSDYNPDVIEEMSLKRKRPMARKSTTPGRRGEFEIC